jgi:hypothetical protein
MVSHQQRRNAVKLIETTVSETAVRMRCADDTDPAKATQWIDFRVPLADLKRPAGQQSQALGNPEVQFLAEVQRSALRYARDVIGAETQRLADLANQIF